MEVLAHKHYCGVFPYFLFRLDSQQIGQMTTWCRMESLVVGDVNYSIDHHNARDWCCGKFSKVDKPSDEIGDRKTNSTFRGYCTVDGQTDLKANHDDESNQQVTYASAISLITL